jgi:ribonuclease VapC
MAEIFVLDASAIIAVLRREPGNERVHAIRESAFVSTVNVAEARSKLSDYGMSIDEVDRALALLSVREMQFTVGQARLSGILRESTRSKGLSLGDRACIALAMEKGAVAMTTDSAWVHADLPVAVEMLR